MKSPFSVLLIAISMLMLPASSNAGEPEQNNLKGYYTPDIVRNQLELQFNSNSYFNAAESSTGAQNTVSTYDALDLRGNVLANLQRYINTRKLISTLSIGVASTGNFNHQISELTNDLQLMPDRNKSYTTHTTNQLGVEWINNRYVGQNLFLYYSLGANLTHAYNFSRVIRESDLQSYENKSSVRTRSALLIPGLGIGFGRIERVEDMRQAIYIVDAIQQAGRLNRNLTKDELFRFSQLISGVKNKRFLDSRLHLIDEITTVDGFLKEIGLVDNSDAAYFTNLYDMWQHGDLFGRKSGSEVRLRMLPRFTFTNTQSRLNSMIPDTNHLIIDQNNAFYGQAELQYTYEKPFRLNWQHSVHAGSLASLTKSMMTETTFPTYTSAEIYGGYQLGFYPSTRTYLQAGISQSVWGGKDENATNWTLLAQTELQSALYYYVSRQLRVSGSFNVNRLWNQLLPTTSKQLSLRLNTTLTYYIF